MTFRKLVICSLIAVFFAGVFLQAQPRLEIRAASSTRVAGWEPMPAPGGESVWVSPIAALTAADIARVESRPQPDGQPAVGMVFTADGARKMAQLSAAQISQPIALLLDGNVVWTPIVRGIIEKEAMLTGVTPDVIQRVLALRKQ